jgi:hypothetical protein
MEKAETDIFADDINLSTSDYPLTESHDLFIAYK